MSRGSELYDQSGAVVGELVADELICFEGQPVTEDLIEHVSDRIAARVALVGLKEAAEILEESRAFITQLQVNRDERLPQPITRLATGPIWLLSDIEAAKPIPRKRPFMGNQHKNTQTVQNANKGIVS